MYNISGIIRKAAVAPESHRLTALPDLGLGSNVMKNVFISLLSTAPESGLR